jgi:hypothetical protein
VDGQKQGLNTTGNTAHNISPSVKGGSSVSKLWSESVRVRVTLQLTVSQSVRLGVEPNLGLLTRDIFFFFWTVSVLS